MNPRRLPGCAVGVVTDLNDPVQIGRIKVKFPWMDDSETSYWCRIVATQAGGSRGDFIRAEVGDEVLVMFERGDANQPCVVGVLWNGQDAPPGPGNGDGKNDHKFFQSRSGHQLIFNDGDDGGYIEVHDSSQKLHTKLDVPGKHVHWLADSGTIQISAPEGKIRMECVDFLLHSTNDTQQSVAKQHEVKVTGTRTYKAKTLTQTAGSSLSVTTPNLSVSCVVLTSSTGSTTAGIGSLSATIEPQVEMEFKGTVTRTVTGAQKIEAKSFRTENEHGPSGPLTITAGQVSLDTGAVGASTGAALTVNGGAVSIEATKIAFAKDSQDGQGVGKASIISFLGGAVLLNPQGAVMPSPKMLDMLMGADFHNQAPGAALAPFPLAPHAFVLPLLLDTKTTVLVNCMPAGTSGSTAVGVHIPPTYAPAFVPIPMTYRMIINSAIVALFVPAVMALGGLAVGLAQAHMAGTNPQAVLMAGASSGGEAAWRWFRGAFPMTQSWGAFVAFLAGLMPYPVANGSISIGSPSVTAEDSPMSLTMQMFGNSCSDVPIVPNAMVMGGSNVMVGITLSAYLQQLAMQVVKGLLTKAGGKAMEKLNPPRGGALDRVVFPGLQQYSPTSRTTAPATRQADCQGEGHPVDPVTGTLYDKEADAELPGPLPFRLERNYNSIAARDRFGGLLGIGWRLNIESVLTLHYGQGLPKFWVRHDDELRTVALPWLEELGQWHYDPAERLEFCRADENVWDVRDRDGITWRYEVHQKDRARLASYFDRHGNAVTLQYHKGEDLPHGLTDSAGRRLVLKVENERLQSLWCEGRDQGWTGRELCAWRYDERGRLVEVKRGDGTVRRFGYDDRGRLVRDVEAGGYVWTFHYDEQNRVTTTYGEDLHEYAHLDYQPLASLTVVTDHTGRKRLVKYDERGHIVTRVDREGDAVHQAYDEHGQRVAETDANGNVTEYAYDASGRLLEKVLPDGAKHVYAYDARGLLVRAEDACGAVITHAYDVHGNRVRTRHPDGSTTLRRYDGRGLVVAEIGPDGSEHAFAYDEAGNLVEETHDGVTTQHAYDEVGRRIRTIDADGRVTRFTWDGRGRMLTREHPDGRTERWRYSPSGFLAEYTDREGHTWARVHDSMCRQTERRSPEGRLLRTTRGDNNRYAAHLDAEGHGWRYAYDADHRVVRVQADGVTEHYERDLAGHVVATRYADGGWRKFENDVEGRQLCCETRDGARQLFERDPAGRLIEALEVPPGTAPRQEDGLPQPGERRVAWRRTADGRVTEEVGPGGRVRQRFAPGGRLTRLDVDGVAIDIVRDDRGRPVAVRAPDGVHRIEGPASVTPAGARTVEDALGWSLVDAERRPVAAYDATLDADGRRVAEKLTTVGRYGWQHQYAFDRDGRLAERTDKSGNRLLPGATYGEGRRLLADARGPVVHDLRGRVVSREVEGGTQRLWWDDLERLREVEQPDGTVIRYRYDALSRLVERLEDRIDGPVTRWRFLWCEHRLVGEERPDGSRVRYLHLDPGDVTPWAAWVEGPWGCGLHRLHPDGRGAVIAASDGAGRFTWLGEYGTYGECTPRDRGLDQRLRLPGMWADPATGLYYNRYRWYVPEWGRYLSPDPWGVAGGDHPYAYADGDPIHRIDPLGLAGHQHGGNQGDGGGEDGTQPRTQGTQPAGDAGDGGGTLYRRGTGWESTNRLGNQAQQAENAGFPHGVSVTDADGNANLAARFNKDPADASPATRQAFEDAGFPVHHTPTRNDPNHHTVELPKPVTPDAARRFNEVLGRKRR